MLTILICIMLVLVVVGSGYVAYLLFLSYESEIELPSTSPVIIHDDLSRAILSLINDTYSPFYDAKLSDHLLSDLDIDSLDMVDLFFDLSHIVNAKLHAADLYEKYGRNPTIAQLITYVRHAIAAHTPSPEA